MNKGNHRTKTHARRQGFNLFELVLVLAIMGIVAAIAVPRFGRASARYRAAVAARRVVRDLELASRTARNAGASRSLAFDSASGQYTISDLAGLEKSTAPYRVDLSAEPYQSRIDSVDFGGDAEVVFNGYGVGDSGGTIVLKCGDITQTIVFDASKGRAETQ